MTIFWPTYGGSHVQIAKAMMPRLDHGDDRCIILALPPAIETMKASGYPYKTLQDYFFLFDEEMSDIRCLGKTLAEKYHNHQVAFSKEDTAAYFGLSMHFLIKQFGEAKAWEDFEKRERKAFLPIEAMRRIILFEKAQAVCATNTVRTELAAMMAANELGIPCFYFQDTLHVDGDAELVDKIFLINEAFYHKNYDAYIDKGYKPEQICVTGQPSFALYGAFNHNDSKIKVSEDLGFIKGNPLIVWTGYAPDECEFLTYTELCRIAEAHPEWSFAFKLHPTSSNMGDFDHLGIPLPQNVRMMQDYNTPLLISACDVLTTRVSTTGFEALLMGKPLIVINTTGVPYPIRYEERGAAILIEKVEDLENKIIDSLYNQDAKLRMEEGRKYYSSSPDAVESCAAIIRETVENADRK